MGKMTGAARSEEIFREIGSLLLEQAQIAMKEKEWKWKVWKQIYVDIRRPEKSKTTISKIRIVSPDGATEALLDTSLENVPTEATNLFYSLWDTKDEEYSTKWYGLKFVVFPDGKWEVDFNVDPKCAVDPTFFDD